MHNIEHYYTIADGVLNCKLGAARVILPWPLPPIAAPMCYIRE